jgi:signal transduction histidine kinase
MPSRLVPAAIGLTVLIALAGFTWERARFGPTDAATAARIEHEVRSTVAERASEVEALARRVAGEGALIADATASRDRLPALFDRLLVLAEPVDQHGVAVTIYVPDATPVGYRVLAWSDGPGEKNLAAERLSGPAALFIAPGHAGMRLVFVDPVGLSGHRIAVAVAETVLASTTPGVSTERRLATSFGPVSVIEQYASAREDMSGPNGFVVTSPGGSPLLEVHVAPADLAARRTGFRRRTLAVATLPIVILVTLVTLRLARQRRVGHRVGLTVGALLAVTAAAGLLAGALWLAQLPVTLQWTVAAGWAVGLSALGPGVLWWRGVRRRAPQTALASFVRDQFTAGVVLAIAVELLARTLDHSITPAVLENPSVLFPFDGTALSLLATRLGFELAAAWTAASLLAALAVRWRLTAWPPAAAIAVACWLAPTVALTAAGRGTAALAAGASLLIAAAGAIFGLLALPLRRAHRHAAQSTRLLLAFLTLVVPLVVVYPLGAETAERRARDVIERDYAPTTMRQPQELRATLMRAQQEIDRLPSLPGLVSGAPSLDTQPAFLVWSQTGLSRVQAISDVELYGRDGALVSPFAHNLPEYVNRASLRAWQGHSCTWEVFGEVTSFGAQERLMLHAQRGVCDATGSLLGAVVVHVASTDYASLPFVSSPNPYSDVLAAADATPAQPRLPDLVVAVYGWGFEPIFTSGPVPWPMGQAVFDRLYQSGTPYWGDYVADGRRYHVYFAQNRVGVYALGYPEPSWLEHATRVAELVALTALLFILCQAAALLYAPLIRQPKPPLRILLHEIRSSFYRKLFLAFVAVAVAPVLVAALAFGGYLTARFRADVENEAASTVTTARRVFEELTAASGRGAEAQTATDDVMVWIRQVIEQDVNLYSGSELSATSQRDLFDSGLLPARTPATVYRAIALDRRPTFLAEDRVGSFPFLVAAAPVVSHGRDSVLTVPLASRQREIEREIDTLSRRVLLGSVWVMLLAAGLGAWLAGRVADPVARLTRATRQIAAGRLDVRVSVDTPDELGRLVEDFNGMAETLGRQRDELARTHQVRAWSEMARQVAHEIKNPLTPIQLAAEHLQQVHEDRGRPLGGILDQCLQTILGQVRNLRQIASQFSTFAGSPTLHLEAVAPDDLLASVVDPYRVGLAGRVTFDVQVPDTLPAIRADRTLLARALTNLVENAVQAMPQGGRLTVRGTVDGGSLLLRFADTGAGMEPAALERAFEPYFSTKTGGSGLGLANAKRHVEMHGGTIAVTSLPGQGTTFTLRLPLAAVPRG